MYIENEIIRHLFTCICCTIVFHPYFLLSQEYRNKTFVQQEKQCYSPLLITIYSSLTHGLNNDENPSNSAFDKIFNLWIPKFIAQYVRLQQPQRKIRWTSAHTKAFEHIITGDSCVISNMNGMIDDTQLYSINDDVKHMIEQHLEMKSMMNTSANTLQLKVIFEQKIVGQMLHSLEKCKTHSDFMIDIQRILSLFQFSDFMKHFCSQPSFFIVLERILAVVPLSVDDDRTFSLILQCINHLMQSQVFIQIIKKYQISESKQNIPLPIKLMKKLRDLISEKYVKFIHDIPASYTLLPTQPSSKNRKPVVFQMDLSSTRIKVISRLFKLFENYVLFLLKYEIIDGEQSIHQILQCILKQFIINPIEYQHILSNYGLIHDSVRLQTALQCLLSIFTSTDGLVGNKIFIQYFDQILTCLMNIASRGRIPNSFLFKNDFQIALVSIDFILEHFIAGFSILLMFFIFLIFCILKICLISTQIPIKFMNIVNNSHG